MFSGFLDIQYFAIIWLDINLVCNALTSSYLDVSILREIKDYQGPGVHHLKAVLIKTFE